VRLQVLSASEATREIGPLGLPIRLTGLPVARALTAAPPLPVWTVTVFVSKYLYRMAAGAKPVMRPKPLTVSRVTNRAVRSAESSTLTVVVEGGLVIVRGARICWMLPALPILTVVLGL